MQRIQVLKYYVLACMLSESRINPFESQETKPYKDDPRITVMMQFVEAFQKSDIDQFNTLIRNHEGEIMSDKFIRIFLDDLVLTIRSQGIVNLVKPYSRISLEYLSTSLAVDIESVERILMKLVLDKRLPHARIDMINGWLELNYESGPSIEEHESSGSLPARYRDSELDQKKQQEQQFLAAGQASDSVVSVTDRYKALLGWLGSACKLQASINMSRGE